MAGRAGGGKMEPSRAIHLGSSVSLKCQKDANDEMDEMMNIQNLAINPEKQRKD